MDYPYPNDPSHIACFPANFASRSLAHKPLRRERIDFADSEKVFETWCNVWGDRILFQRIEYRKETSGVKHEFVYLRDLSLKEGYSQSSPPFNPPSDRFWPPELPWEPAFYERIQAFRCKLERTGHPEAQVNALDRTPAFDYIDFKQNSDLTNDEQASTVELSITLDAPMSLKMVLGVCEAMCLHPEARFYTLQKFNCFFFSWTIIISVLRIAANWTELLRQQQNQIVGSMIEKLAMLGDAQNLWSDEENDRANMVLLISGEYGLSQPPDTTLRPLARNVEEQCKNDSTWQTICASCDSSLWTDDRRDAVGGPFQQLLNEVADATSSAAVAGTGEKNILSLFWRDIHIPLDDRWPVTVQTEFNRLLGLYTRSGVWKSFGTALQQTSDKETNQLNLLAQSQSATARRSLSQQIRSSPAILGPRLALLGRQAALNGARAAADAFLNMPHVGENDPPPLPLLQVRHTLQTIWFMPGQFQNVARIAPPFLSVLSA